MSVGTKRIQLHFPFDFRDIANKKIKEESEFSHLNQIAGAKSQIALLFHENRKIQQRLDAQLEIFKAQEALLAQQDEAIGKLTEEISAILSMLLDK